MIYRIQFRRRQIIEEVFWTVTDFDPHDGTRLPDALKEGRLLLRPQAPTIYKDEITLDWVQSERTSTRELPQP